MEQEQRKKHSDERRGTNQRFGKKVGVKVADGNEQTEGLGAGRDYASEKSAKQVPSKRFLGQNFWR